MKPIQPDFSKFLTLSFGLAVAGISIQSAQAAPLTWDGLTSGTWGTATNWNPDQVPTTADALTILGPGNAAGTLAIDVNAAAAAGTINFTNTSSTSLTNTSGSSKSLTLQSGLTTGAGAVTIGTTTSATNVTVALGTSQTWDIGAGGLTTNGLTGNFVATKTGAGTWTVQGSSSTIGGITVDNGTIQLNGSGGSVNIFGSAGTFTLGTAANPANNVALQSSSSSSTGLVASIVVASGAGTRTISYSSNGGTALAFAGTVTLNKDLIAKHSNTSGGGLQFSNTVSGVGGLDLTGNTGIVTLTGANTYLGATTLAGGRLNLKNQLAAQNSTINLTGATSTALIFDSAVVANAFTVGGLASTTSGAGKDIALVNSTVAGVVPGRDFFPVKTLERNGAG